MMNDTALRDAIDIIGVHTMGRLNGVTVPAQAKAQMAAMHKPFWNTEQHYGTHAGEGPDSCRDWATAAELALTLNRLYIQENMTSTISGT
jgi:O-glycosyl hydrolase